MKMSPAHLKKVDLSSPVICGDAIPVPGAFVLWDIPLVAQEYSACAEIRTEAGSWLVDLSNADLVDLHAAIGRLLEQGAGHADIAPISR